MKKGLVIGIIFLFIGVAVAPSINASVAEPELVEITTEFCGMDGIKPHTAKLTTQETQELETLFDDIKARLDAAEGREETVEIFNDAIAELDRFGLLGDMSKKEIKQLITKRGINSIFNNHNEKHNSGLENDEINNFFCLIAGNIQNSVPLPQEMNLIMLFYKYLLYLLATTSDSYLWALYFTLIVCYEIVMANYIELKSFIPIDILNKILFMEPSQGWIHTIGLLGTQNKSGILYGKIETPFWRAIGIRGFTGISIWLKPYESAKFFYLGSALQVRVSSEPPNV
jgi:hypothetical protein